jgi:serine/threonine-protein kinase
LWVAADGSDAPEELFTGDSSLYPYSFSGDGKMLAYVESAGPQRIHILNLEGNLDQEVVLPHPVLYFDPALSPDGRWLAYSSDESGRDEIYVCAFPGPGGKWQLSTGGGNDPAWSRDGRELFFLSARRMMLVSVETEPHFSASRPKVLFKFDFDPTHYHGRGYDISADGKRLLVVQRPTPTAGETTTPTLQVTLNWFEELKRLVPTESD